MPFASEDQVNTALKPHFSEFVSLLLGAHEDWTKSAFAASMQDPKVRANVIWNQFLYRAKAAFEGRNGIRVENMRHWQGVVVGNSFFVRMKKASNKLLSQNYPTQSALKFNDASVDMFEGIIRLELLYTLDELGTSIERIVVAQRHKSKILWAIDLLDSAEDHGQTVFTLPLAPNGGGTPAERLIKPKKTVVPLKKKRGTNDDGS
ncbi:hypothetical protein BH10PSE18_BH10PSE18_08030 [soil metagenome]